MKKEIPYGRHNISEDDLNEVIKILKSDFLTQGPMVQEFEKNFAKYVGAEYAVAVINGTAALHLAALALIQKSKKVITTPLSFVATSNAVLYSGGQVEFVDIDPKTYALDLNQVEDLFKKSAPGTYEGIMPVDFGGLPLPMNELKNIADKYGAWIIEDSCHALGAEFLDTEGQWNKVGNGKYSDLTAFSFHPVKHITSGEGGMITTNSKQLYDKLTMLRTHGITKNPDLMSTNDGPWYYEMQTLGYNYRIPDILCALGLSQLKGINSNVERRQAIANRYFKELENTPYILPSRKNNLKSSYHLFVIQSEDRDNLYAYLKKNKVLAQVHYIPIYHQPFYQKLLTKKYHLKNVEEYYRRALSIPMYHALSDDEQSYVIELLKNYER